MTSPPSSSHSKLTMKLLVDTKNNKVLFAEASKTVVDFLLNILQNLPGKYMLPQHSEKRLLNPNVKLFSPEMSTLLSTTIGKAPNPTAQISGVVRDGVTLVMDDLVIQPVTSVIEVVKEFNIQENAALKEMVVELGLDEGIKSVKASMQTKMVLTSVFIKNKIDISSIS